MVSSASEELVELRVPRSALTLVQGPPSHVSQATAERECGIPRGVYLDLAREYGRSGGDVIITGKLRIVERERFLAWLRARSRASAPRSDASPVDGADDYASELGLVRRSGR
jgi:hypothetical protein